MKPDLLKWNGGFQAVEALSLAQGQAPRAEPTPHLPLSPTAKPEKM